MARLRIVHVSDLHLFVEANGDQRPVEEISALVRQGIAFGRSGGGQSVFGGFEVHDHEALEALRATLKRLRASTTPTVVVQSGDVSAFGCRRGARLSFPEWDYWLGQVRDKAPPAWIDLFGNHDVWPGTFPALSPWSIEETRNALRSAPYFPQQLPERHAVKVDGHRVELYTVNTVQHTAIANSLADGAIDFDHPDPTTPPGYQHGGDDPLGFVEWLALQNRPAYHGTLVVRILVMHHPPHFFGLPAGRLAAWWEQLTSGTMTSESTLCRWLGHMHTMNLPIHLVLAGHRHALDPAVGATPRQLQTNVAAVQLVCGTPTQLDADHSLSVYDVDLDDNGFAVRRTVYHRSLTAIDFEPGVVETILSFP